MFPGVAEWSILIAVCIATGALAARKGYSFWLWVLAGGVIGLVILAFLPFTSKPGLSAERIAEARRSGNLIGGVLSSATLAAMTLNLLYI